MYYSFYCNTSSGQVSFKPQLNGTSYRVTNINSSARTFDIQVKDAPYDRSLSSLLNQLPNPFTLSKWLGNNRSEVKDGGIEIRWETPQEPSCNSSRDCKDWPNSTCNITRDGKKRCLCKGNFLWDGLNLNCTTKGWHTISCVYIWHIMIDCSINSEERIKPLGGSCPIY
jgi:hypothetical protein